MNILQVKNKGQVTPISQHEAVKTSKMILQDLSSCMPVEILSNAIKLDLELKKFRNKNKDMKIVGLDSTSSPGNKTLQLAELCSKVYAFERDPKRAGVLQSRVTKALNGGDSIVCLNQDFLTIKIPGFETKTDEIIKFIVCDPSCSGSGMRLHSTITQDEVKCSLDTRTPGDVMPRVENLSKF